MADNAYKQYDRKVRTQTIEETFSKGMYYTNVPLAEGALNTLINFDIDNTIGCLRPRRGLHISQLAFPKTILEEDREKRTPHFIVGAEYHADAEDAATYRIVTGQVTNEQVPFKDNPEKLTKLYLGELHFDKVDLSNTAKAIDTLDILDADSRTRRYTEGFFYKNMVYPYTRTREGANQYEHRYAAFIKPKGVSIHGMPVKDENQIAKQVGTFAYNGDYYTFDVAKNKLFKTDFKTDLADDSQYIEPRKVTPKEAVAWGYNMLLENPYEFANDDYPGSITLLGCLPYDTFNKIKLTPQVNQTVKLKCYYAGPYGTAYKVLWEWKELTGSVWSPIANEQTVTLSDDPFMVDFSFPASQIMVRITCHKVDDDAPEQVLTVGFDLTKDKAQDISRVGDVRYSLERAWGMAYWKQRLLVYGVPEDPTILFFSEVNDPTYFPYPNNVEVFDEPIQYVVPFLEQLLVFTTTKLWVMSLSSDGLSWTTQLLQSNLSNNLWDVHLIKVVKNMVFFRSGEYFYMLVPKSSSATGLTIAPISANIVELFDNFEKFVVESVEMLYNYSDELELMHYYNYLDYNDMHIVYVFRDVNKRLLNLHLIYNTNDRSWRAHFYESDSFVFPIKADATNNGLLVSLMALYTKGVDGRRKKRLGYQILHYEHTAVFDCYYTMNGHYRQHKDLIYRNFQYCNTGHRNHNSAYKKRFRELQFMINNQSFNPLTYYTSFLLDGDERRFAKAYRTRVIKEPNAHDSGELVLERIFNEDAKTQLLPSTHLSKPCPNENTWVPWEMCVSQFPKNNLWKARIPISGKGYAGQLLLLTQDELDYELLNMIWVYRLMNSR